MDFNQSLDNDDVLMKMKTEGSEKAGQRYIEAFDVACKCESPSPTPSRFSIASSLNRHTQIHCP